MHRFSLHAGLVITVSLILFSACSTRTDTQETDQSADAASDSTTFVGVIEKFEQTNELYTDLFFKKDYDPDLFDFLTKSPDSIVYVDDEIRRSSMPFPVADEYFDLNGIDQVNVFDVFGKLLGTAKFKRVEYLQDLIEGKFVAVFKMNEIIHGTPSYCIGGAIDSSVSEGFAYNSKTVKALDRETLKKIESKESDSLLIYEIQLKDDDQSYYLITANAASFIVESRSKRVLYKSQEEIINFVIPVPVISNGKPLFLIGFEKPETDNTWNSLLKFNGSNYEICFHNRF